jgi:RNA polymerase sigma factor (sigma-70 family)
MPGFFMLLPPNGGNNANQPLGTLYRSISLISDFLNLTKFKKSKGDQKMSKKTYIVESYDPATRKIERVTVTHEVYNAYRRSGWNIADNNQSFFKHEIQMSSLIGGEDGGYDNFREFIGDPEAVDNAVAERMLLEALYKALDQLSESDCDLIRALYFEGKTLSEYGEEKGCAISTLSERRKRILRDLKKVLKNFAE